MFGLLALTCRRHVNYSFPLRQPLIPIYEHNIQYHIVIKYNSYLVELMFFVWFDGLVIYLVVA